MICINSCKCIGCISLWAIIVLTSIDRTSARNRIITKDTLLTPILEKRIEEMTDGEFRYFFEFQKSIDDFNPCDDNFLKEVVQKEIKEMTQNEFEYFNEFILGCENVVPCSLKQYLLIKDKQPFYMTNNELEFFDECTDECQQYMEKYHPTKKQQRKKYFRIIGLSTSLALGALLGSVSYAKWSSGIE